MTGLALLAAAVVPGGAVLVGLPAAVHLDAVPTPRSAVTWAIAPANADGPDGRVSIRHELDPGERVLEHVTATNFGPAAAEFLVYASDGSLGADGDFDLLPHGTEPDDGGAWIRIGDPAGTDDGWAPERRVVVEPESSVTLPVVIEVPAEALPGDHPAGIVAELVQPGDALRLSTRVGVRTHLRVTGALEPRLSVTGLRTRWAPSWNPFAPGTLTLDHTVANDGNVRLGARTDVAVDGPFGWGRVETSWEQREILPRQDVAATTELELWPWGRVRGLVDVEPVVVGDDVVAPAPRGDVGELTAWVLPWPQLVELGLLAGLVIAALRYRRRSAARLAAKIEAAVAARTEALRQDPGRATPGAGE